MGWDAGQKVEYRNYSNISTPLEFRPLLIFQNHNYFFVLLNFDHANLKKKNFSTEQTGRHDKHGCSHFVEVQDLELVLPLSKNDVRYVYI